MRLVHLKYMRRPRRKKGAETMQRWLLSVAIALLGVLILGVGMASAAEAGGSGSGASSAFALVSSSIPDGAHDVLPDSQIQLKFSKNVTNITVKENNQSCFSMVDNLGNNIDLNVIMADDQLERYKRNDIVIAPVNPLSESRLYTLTISEKLTCKNGETLEEPQIITFSTIGYESTQATTLPGTHQTESSIANKYLWPVAGLVVAAALGWFLLKRKR